MTRIQSFEKVISDFKELLLLKKQHESEILKTFPIVIEKFKQLKEIVYPKRLNDVKQFISSNPHLYRLSAFELMEHNFRENSHSNILQYLFDYNNLGNESVNILQKIISNTKTEITQHIVENIEKKNYTVHREYPTNKGRIDLLISDRVNKINIIIENKLLADIAIKEVNDSNEITKTQLDDYYEYINSNFKDYKNIFILLSYYSYEEEIENYIHINYETIYNSIKTSENNDLILHEYKTLLISILTGIDKTEVIKIILKIKNDSQINLNSIEKLNKIASYEID